MSIRDIQINKALDKITKNKLENGVKPEEHTISYLLNEYFKENIPGTPTMEYRKVEMPLAMREKPKISSEDYNTMLNEIDEDLEVLYEDIMNKNERLVDNFIYYENERSKLLNELTDYSSYINNVIKMAQGSNKYYDIKTENFNNFNTIDMNKTNALIDLNNSLVTLSPELNRSDKVPIMDAEVSIIDVSPKEYVKRNKLTNVNNCINDFVNDSWIEKLHITNIDIVKNVSITLQLDFDEKILFSQLEITSKDHLNKEVHLQYRTEEGNWNKLDSGLQPEEFSSYNLWSFNPIKTNSLRITISEKINSKSSKDYSIFNINDISMYYTYYENKSYVETEKYSIDHKLSSTFDGITIKPDSIIPSSGNINYNMKFYDSNYNLLELKGLEKHEINPGEELSLNTTEIKEKNYTVDDISHLPKYNSYGIKYYSLDNNIPDDNIDKELKLYKGISQWNSNKYEKYTRKDEEISLSDFNNPPIEEKNIIKDYNLSFSKYIREYFNINRITLTNTLYIDKNNVSSDSDIEDYIKIMYKDGSSINTLSQSNYTIKYYDETVNDASNAYKEITSDHINNTSNVVFKDAIVEIDTEPSSYDVIFVKYLSTNVRHLYNTYIYSEEPQTYVSDLFNIPPQVRNGFEYNTQLYVNNGRAKKYNGNTYNNRVLESKDGISNLRNYDGVDISSSYYYDIKLDEGWNKIMYVAYTSIGSNFYTETKTGNTQESLDLIDIDSNANYNDLSKIACSSYRGQKENMNYSSIYDLQNKITINENNYFAIDAGNLIVNTPILANYHAEYLTEVKPVSYFTLGATLNTDNKFVTPILNSIDIDFFY